jgi:ParB-like chromosome segregation protein Spo0J
MKKPLPVKVHPIANIFPMMSDEEFAGLKKDIAEHGIREDVVFWKEELIDGRNRLAACIELGIEWNGHAAELDDDIDPVAYVISHNLHRRHLDVSQRAMVAGRLRSMFDDEAKGRQQKHGNTAPGKPKTLVESLPPVKKARDAAGDALNVSGKSVDAATKVLKSGNEELIAKVESGEVSVSKAAAIVTGKAAKPKKKKQVEETYDIDEPGDEPPLPKGETVFTRLRELFDEMSPLQRVTAGGMWRNWCDPE